MIIRFRLPPLSVLIYGSILLPSLIPLTILGGSLPPPSTSTTMPDTTLYLELVVNDRNFGSTVPISYRNNRYYLSQSQLRTIGLPISEPLAPEIAIDNMAGVNVKYDGENQRLLINVPSEWLPKQQIEVTEQDDFNLAQSSLGALFNYDIYATQGYPYSSLTHFQHGQNSAFLIVLACSVIPAFIAPTSQVITTQMTRKAIFVLIPSGRRMTKNICCVIAQVTSLPVLCHGAVRYVLAAFR